MWARTKHVGGGEVDWTSLSESAKEGRLFWRGGKLKIAGNEVIFAEMGSTLLNRRRMQRSPLSDEDLGSLYVLHLRRKARKATDTFFNQFHMHMEEDENRPSYSFIIQKYDSAA